MPTWRTPRRRSAAPSTSASSRGCLWRESLREPQTSALGPPGPPAHQPPRPTRPPGPPGPPAHQAPGGAPCACAVCAWPAGAFILGFPISALLDAKYGLRAPMYVAAAVGLLNFVLIILLVPESLPAEQRKVWLPARPRSHARAMPLPRTLCPCPHVLSACGARAKHVLCARSAGQEA